MGDGRDLAGDISGLAGAVETGGVGSVGAGVIGVVGTGLVSTVAVGVGSDGGLAEERGSDTGDLGGAIAGVQRFSGLGATVSGVAAGVAGAELASGVTDQFLIGGNDCSV